MKLSLLLSGGACKVRPQKKIHIHDPCISSIRRSLQKILISLPDIRAMVEIEIRKERPGLRAARLRRLLTASRRMPRMLEIGIEKPSLAPPLGKLFRYRLQYPQLRHHFIDIVLHPALTASLMPCLHPHLQILQIEIHPSPAALHFREREETARISCCMQLLQKGMEQLFNLLIARRIDIRLHHAQHPLRSRSFLFRIPQLIGTQIPRKRLSDFLMHMKASRIHLPQLPAGERTSGIRRLPVETQRTRDVLLRPIALGEAHRHAKETQRIAAHGPLHVPGKCLLIISRRRARREMLAVKIPDRCICFIHPRLDRLFQPGERDVSHLDHTKSILTHEHPRPVRPPVDSLLETFTIESKGCLIIPLPAKPLLTHLS